MKGLILKDIINMRSQLKLYLIIMAMWFVLGMINDSPGFFSGVMVMFIIMIPMTTMAYDDKVKWNSYALTMPVSRKDLIVSKYLMMYVGLVIIACFSIVGCFIINGNINDSLELTLTILPTGLILMSVLMPIIFKFGVEKGRFIFIGVAVLISIVMVCVEKYGNLRIPDISTGELIIILFGAAVIATIISLMVSVRIYNNKDF